MAKSCNNLVNVIVGDLEDDFVRLRQLCTTDEQQSIVINLLHKLKTYSNPFEGLESEYSYRVYMEKSGYYVSPKQYCIRSYNASVLQPSTGYVNSSTAENMGQYIPMALMITALHTNTDLIKMLLLRDTRPCSSHVEQLHTFLDGLHWKRHPLANGKVLLIRLYVDDFEPCNALGSHRTLYKIGTIYFQFECLPSSFNAKLENMFLSLCYHTDDVKTFGWGSVLKPLIDELKVLESTGMSLKIDNVDISFKVVISCITGDNLFLNGILGFTEAFTANHPCRHCNIGRKDFQTQFCESEDLVRTVEQYDSDILNSTVQESGIKFASPLNELQYFHAAKNYVQDLMHDALEGVCKYDISLIMNYMVDSNNITLEHLNGLLNKFSYGKHDIVNKPVMLTETALKTSTLPLSASQMWCLTRTLALAVGS
jgi:hypothetical protein